MKILLWPHPALKWVCSPVDPADREFLTQLQEMKVLMHAARGQGLAANQVGLNKRMLVAGDQFFVNPTIVGTGGPWRKVTEGCLSVPGVFEEVVRATSVVLEHLDTKAGVTVVETFSGTLGHVLQHECEHLDGSMFFDRLPGGKKDQIRAFMRQVKKTQ